MNRLKELRKDRGISLKELSRCLNVKVTDGQLSNYENGNRNFRDENILKAIAKYFDVSIPYLLGYSKIRNDKYVIDLQDVLHREYELKLEKAKLEKNLEEALAKIDEKDKRISELEENIDYIFDQLDSAFKRKG